MNSCRMTFRILITLFVMLAFVSSLAIAEKVDPKAASLKAIGTGNIVPTAIKATHSVAVPDKGPIEPFGISSKSAAQFHKSGGPLKEGLSGLLSEGFETSVPPAGWSQVITNSSYTWQLSTDYVHTGLSSANVPWDYAQDEWLITPILDFTGVSAPDLRVSFWFNMSYYWAVTPYNNYNIEVWISTDGGANFATKLWDEDSYGTFSNFTWYEATVSLTAYAGQSNVKLAWRYVGNDDADGSIDDIYVTDDAAPTGRCCYDLGASCKDNTAVECSAIGGTWDGTKTCDANPCPVPGVGDDCANPIIVDFATQLPYTDAGQYTCGRVADYAGTTCLGSYDGGEDIVYRLDVASPIDVTVSLDPKGTTWTGFAIGTSCPPAGTCVLVKTNSGGSAYSGFASLAAGTYYLIVSTWPTPDCIPDFDLSIVAASAVTNDDCDDAIDIGDVTSLPFSTAAATFDGPGGFIAGPNVWYRYTATCTGAASVSLCGSSYDTRVRIFDGGTCPTDPTSLAENDDACGLQSTATFACVTGNQYMIEVGGYTTASGDGILTVSCFLPPENDNCVDVTPVPLTVGSPLVFTGNSAGATNDCSLFAPDAEVWHAFTTTECMNVTVDYCGSAPAFETVYIVLVEGCPCGSYLLGEYDFTTCIDGNGTIRFKNLPAGTWYVPVPSDPAGGASGPYTINVNGTECLPAPPNDNCEDVTPVVLTSGVPVTFTGTTTGATADCASFPGENVWEAFTITHNSNVTLDYCTTSPAYGNAWLNLALGCPCESFTSAGVWETVSCGDGNVTIVWSGLAAGTYYYPVMNDPANGADGPYAIHVVADAVFGYCPAGSGMCDEYISNVAVGTINNGSECGSGGYTDFSSISTDMAQGGSYPITVDNGYPYSSDQCGIWIDWNGDFDFTVDEQVAVTGTPGSGPYSATIAAPCDVDPGLKRLRIRITYTGVVSPCGIPSYGEVEDYTINLTGSSVASGTVIVPDPQYAYYIHALVPMTDEFDVGDFGGTYSGDDVDLPTVRVNGEIPTSAEVVNCGGLKILMPLTEFIDNYGVLWDTTITTFTITGSYTDATTFSFDGDVTLIGHASHHPTEFILPPHAVVLPGDFDASGSLNVSDAVAIIAYIFSGGSAPSNLLVGDVNCSASVNISDAVFMIAYIFAGGGAPCR